MFSNNIFAFKTWRIAHLYTAPRLNFYIYVFIYYLPSIFPQDPEVPDSASQSSASPDQSIGQATTDKTEASVADPAKDSQQNIQGQQSLNTEDNGEEEGVLPTDQQGEEQQMEAEESTEQVKNSFSRKLRFLK